MNALSPAMRLFNIARAIDPYYSSVDVLLPLTADGNDAGPSARTITVVGTPTYSSAGAALDGLTEYFQYSGTAIGTSEFIIDGRFSLDIVTDEMIFDYRPVATNGAYPTLLVSSGALTYYVDSANKISGGSLSSSTVYYFAVFRKSGTTYLQLDDQILGSFSDSFTYLAPASRPRIAASGFSGAATGGTFRDFRVTIGTDRGRAASISGSTADVPESPFPTTGP